MCVWNFLNTNNFIISLVQHQMWFQFSTYDWNETYHLLDVRVFFWLFMFSSFNQVFLNLFSDFNWLHRFWNKVQQVEFANIITFACYKKCLNNFNYIAITLKGFDCEWTVVTANMIWRQCNGINCMLDFHCFNKKCNRTRLKICITFMKSKFLYSKKLWFRVAEMVSSNDKKDLCKILYFVKLYAQWNRIRQMESEFFFLSSTDIYILQWIMKSKNKMQIICVFVYKCK